MHTQCALHIRAYAHAHAMCPPYQGLRPCTRNVPSTLLFPSCYDRLTSPERPILTTSPEQVRCDVIEVAASVLKTQDVHLSTCLS